jgi:biopolymer transport protein ExbB/TolQ
MIFLIALGIVLFVVLVAIKVNRIYRAIQEYKKWKDQQISKVITEIQKCDKTETGRRRYQHLRGEMRQVINRQREAEKHFNEQTEYFKSRFDELDKMAKKTLNISGNNNNTAKETKEVVVNLSKSAKKNDEVLKTLDAALQEDKKRKTKC